MANGWHATKHCYKLLLLFALASTTSKFLDNSSDYFYQNANNLDIENNCPFSLKFGTNIYEYFDNIFVR